MVSPDQARAAAVAAMGDGPAVFDTHLGPWRQASLGEAICVHTVAGQPSYWLLPVQLDGRVIGLVRVSGAGLVFSLATMYRSPTDVSTCPTTPLGCSQDEARRAAAEYVDIRRGETAAAPRLVHDGPPGREAWLVEIRGRRSARHVYVTAGGVYARDARGGERETA